MPPPPPPSKSYLLVLDSSSDEDSEDEYYRRQQDYYNAMRGNSSTIRSAQSQVPKSTPQVSKQSIPKEPSTPVTPPPQEAESKPNIVEDDQIQQNQQSKKLTKNQKRRQRRKKKKKEKVEENKTQTSETKHVSFSNVSIRAYPRAFSGDTVPGHGGWPLGMKLDGYNDLEKVPVEEYETRKQEELHGRWMEILSASKEQNPNDSPKASSPSKKKKDKEKVIDEQIIRLVDGNTADNDESNDTSSKKAIYESRQWDYRSRVRNPLFGMLSEDERHAVFLQASGTDPNKIPDIPPMSPSRNRRKRSNSFGNHPHGGNSPRSRSNSFGNHEPSNGIKGKFNEEYSQAMVHHVRNELEQLRFERNKSGATGCNCRKLVVYLPPKDGSGGKKAQHRRLKPSKVVQELKKRNLYDDSVAAMSRDQMEKLLHKTVESEPCCRDESCFCFRNGIICQADACSCWHDSHVHAKHSSGSSGDPLTNDEIRKRCGNPLGTYLVDIDAIDSYRAEMIKQASDLFICQPVSS